MTTAQKGKPEAKKKDEKPKAPSPNHPRPRKGKTLKDRARNLINVAHPDFREELKVEFEKRFNAKF